MILVSKKESYSNNFVKIIFLGEGGGTRNKEITLQSIRNLYNVYA